MTSYLDKAVEAAMKAHDREEKRLEGQALQSELLSAAIQAAEPYIRQHEREQVQERLEALWKRGEAERHTAGEAFDERDRDADAPNEAALLDDFYGVLSRLFPRCDGEGELDDGDPCPGCPGCLLGLAALSDSKDGEGREPCERCEGSGVEYEGFASQIRKVPCPDCHGTGTKQPESEGEVERLRDERNEAELRATDLGVEMQFAELDYQKIEAKLAEVRAVVEGAPGHKLGEGIRDDLMAILDPPQLAPNQEADDA